LKALRSLLGLPPRCLACHEKISKHIVLESTIIFINENNGGGGRNRTAVPKYSDKSRYMLSLSFMLNLARSAKQDRASRSLLRSHPAKQRQVRQGQPATGSQLGRRPPKERLRD